MNVQPKLQTPGPMPDADRAAAPIVSLRRQPGGPRRYATWEPEPWPLELEVEPWHP